MNGRTIIIAKNTSKTLELANFYSSSRFYRQKSSLYCEEGKIKSKFSGVSKLTTGLSLD